MHPKTEKILRPKNPHVQKAKRVAKTALRLFLGMQFYERLLMFRHLGYWPHILHPRSFNEKTAYRKMYAWKNVPPQLADKWAVRAWVARTVGEKYLNEVYGVYDRAEDIDFSKLPETFVLKATHGSAMNILVCNREGFDEAATREKCRKFLATTYGWLCNELWYASIPHRIIAEKYLSQPGKALPDDYRCFVFDGHMNHAEVDCNRKTPHITNTTMSRDWKLLPFAQYLPCDSDLPKPPCWEEMVEVAEKLGAGFDFVRVDLYSPDGKSVIFGEMTFAHESGWSNFLPTSQDDFEVGKLWRIAAGLGQNNRIY